MKKTLLWMALFIPSLSMASGIYNPGSGAVVSSSTLPAGSTQYIQNSITLQAGSTAYPAFLYVGSSATIPLVSISTMTGSSATITGATISFLKGLNDGSSACAGCSGEYLSCSASAVSATISGQFQDLCSIFISTGDWNIGASEFVDGNSATWGAFNLGISTTSGNSQNGLTFGMTRMRNSFTNGATPTLESSLAIPPLQFLLTSSATWYLKVEATYTAGSPMQYGTLAARRR